MTANNWALLRKFCSNLLQARSTNDGETWKGIDGVQPFWLHRALMEANIVLHCLRHCYYYIVYDSDYYYDYYDYYNDYYELLTTNY